MRGLVAASRDAPEVLDALEEALNEGMDLAREVGSETSDATITGLPCAPAAPCWWTRTQVEPIITISPSNVLKPQPVAWDVA